MNVSRSIQLLSVACLLSLILLGCGQPNAQTTRPEDTAQEPAPSPSATATTPPTTLLTPTLEPVQTPIERPTRSNSTPTAAATATLSSQQVLDRVRQLLTGNAGCALPCWWGIEPGKTTWEAAEAILSPLALRIGDPRPLHIGAPPPKSSQVAYDVLIPVPPDVFPARLEHRYVVQEDIVQRIEVILGKVARYQLPPLLGELGQPPEIWVSTYSQQREGSHPFTVVLYYPDQGILARFDTEAEREGDFVIGCPQKSPALVMVLWFPDKPLSFKEAVDDTLELGPFNEWQYQRLEDVTNLDPGTFFEIFRASDNSTCIKTEAGLWPRS